MNSNGYITAPISLKDDVYTVLGISPSGAYYDLAEACTSDKINAWAKYKPLKCDGYEILTHEDRLSVHYGIKINDATNLDNLFLLGEWEYEKPVLGLNWMRLTDFSDETGTYGYFHNAIAPLQVRFDSTENWPDDVIEVNGETAVDAITGHTENAHLTTLFFTNSSASTGIGGSSLFSPFTCVTLDNIFYEGISDFYDRILNDYYPAIVMRYMLNSVYVYSISLINRKIGNIATPDSSGTILPIIYDFGRNSYVADAKTGTEVEFAFAMVPVTDAYNTFNGQDVVILNGPNGADAGDPNFPVSDYIALNCGKINRKKYTIKNVNPLHITPLYKMVVSYTREDRTDGVDGYKFTLTKITLENLNGGASRYVKLVSGFGGSNVEQDTPDSGIPDDNLIGSLFVDSDKGSVSEIIPTQHHEFYTTAKSNFYGQLIVDGTYAYGDWESPDGMKSVTARIHIQEDTSSSGTFEGESYAD